jgi:hypothetical protein
MTDNSLLPPSGGPASPGRADTRPGPAPGGALFAAVVIIVGSALMGLLGGLLWAAEAPKVVYQVYTLSPPTAYAVNPETSAFIAADGLYCFIALGGGALIGLLSYLFAVRRYGPLPMAGVVIGSTAAAFIAAWIGHRQSGGPGFDHLLATSKPGTLLHAPIELGSHGALAFWPLAAAVVAGGIELISVLRDRHSSPYSVPMPGMESFARWQFPTRPDTGQSPPRGSSQRRLGGSSGPIGGSSAPMEQPGTDGSGDPGRPPG